MPTAKQEATTKRETWRDWMPHISDAIPREEFIESINQEYGTGITLEQVQSWEDRGLLPLPIQGNAYPQNAEFFIRTLHRLERERDGIPSEEAETVRELLQSFAKSLDETAVLDMRDRLAELQEEAEAQRATWIDWMPEGAPDPELLSLPELLGALHERGVTITQYTLDHYRRIGVLPRPIRRRHGGVTQAVYPSWFVPAIAHLKQLQAGGKSLEDIRPLMRAWALSTVQWHQRPMAPK